MGEAVPHLLFNESLREAAESGRGGGGDIHHGPVIRVGSALVNCNQLDE